jgi:hypothetical protein
MPPRAVSTYQQDKFMNLFMSRGLHQHVIEPTRNSNTLDLVFTNEEFAVSDVSILPPLTDSADHDCVLFYLNLDANTLKKQHIRKWSKMDTAAMQLSLELVNWHFFLVTA